MSRRRSAGPVDCKAMYHPTRRRAAQPAGSSAFDRPEPEAEAGAGAGRTAFACLVCLRASDPVRDRHVAIAKSAVAASPARRPGGGLKPVIWAGRTCLVEAPEGAASGRMANPVGRHPPDVVAGISPRPRTSPEGRGSETRLTLKRPSGTGAGRTSSPVRSHPRCERAKPPHMKGAAHRGLRRVPRAGT